MAMTNSGNEGLGSPAPRPAVPPSGGARATLIAKLLAVLPAAISVFLLGLVGQGSFAVVDCYGFAGGWEQVLALAGIVVGAAVGGCWVAVARLFHSKTRARWFVLAGVSLALVAAAVGSYLGFLAHNAASARAEHACDDPVGSTLVSLGQGLEPGPIAIFNGELTWGRDDGTCVLMVNVGEPGAQVEVEAQIARIATAKGLSRIEDHWLSAEGVRLTYEVTYRPATLPAVELQGRRADLP